MKIDKKIKDLPWPEPYQGGREDFKVTMSWPVIGQERMLVATFSINKEKERQPWESCSKQDFRLICSKKTNRAAVLVKGARQRRCCSLEQIMRETARTSPTYCYPEISEADEIALAKWLRRRGTNNHLMPELNAWVEQAIEAEKQAERDARGELHDEDVHLCPEELPAGLVEFICQEVLPADNVLLYKKGNVRGTCYRCREKVRAAYGQRFRQHEMTKCPNCGGKVHAVLEGGESFKADYVDDIATIQKGTDGATLFVRQWHLCRDPSAQWEDIPGQLEEVARYAVRGNKAAKWQHEVKESFYMKSWRSRLAEWERMEKVTCVYDGQYYFYLPRDWKTQLQGTSLRYCDLGGYAADAQANRRDRNTIRFLMDWARYPAVEKLWKAGYTGLVHEHLRGVFKQNQHVIRWQRNSIQAAIRFPFRLLKALAPEKWTMNKMRETAEAWEMCSKKQIKESEIAELVKIPCTIDLVRCAVEHVSVRKVAAYIDKGIAAEIEERKAQKAKAQAAGEYYWGENNPYQMPQTYRDYLRDCEKLGLDLNDEAVLFPRDLAAAHARTIAQIKHKANEVHREGFRKNVEKAAKLAWEHDGLLIRPPVDGDELTAEGAALHHCVGGYVESVAKGSTMILLIRRAEEPDKPFYTLEWKNGKVIQCRTTHNKSYTTDEQIAAFVEAWVKRVSAKGKKKKENAA